MFEHLPGHMEISTVIQQDDTINKCTMMFVLGTYLLQYLMVISCTDCVITSFKMQKQRSFSVPSGPVLDIFAIFKVRHNVI